MHLLLDTWNDEHYIGDTRVDLVISTGSVIFDKNNRRVVVKGIPDTVVFSNEYTDDELIYQCAVRAIEVLTRNHGWILFTPKL